MVQTSEAIPQVPTDQTHLSENESERNDATTKLQEDAYISLADYQSIQAKTPADLYAMPPIELVGTEDFSPSSVTIAADAEAVTESATVAVPQQQDGGLFGVLGELGKGVWNHVTTDFGSVALSFAGSVLGTAAIAAGGAALAAGAAALGIVTAPAWLTISATVAVVGGGVALAGWMLSENAPQWYKDAETIWNASKYSAEEVAAAREGVQNFAGGAVDFGVGLVGGGWYLKEAAKLTAEKAAAEAAKVAAGEATEAAVKETAETAVRETVEAGAQETAETAAKETLGSAAGETAQTASIEVAETTTKQTAQTASTDNFVGSYFDDSIAPLKPGEKLALGDDLWLVPKSERVNLMRSRLQALSVDGDVEQAAFKTLTSSREINLFAQEFNKLEILPLFSAGRIRNTVSVVGVKPGTDKAWLAAADRLEEQSVAKLREVIANPPAQFNQAEISLFPKMLDDVLNGKPANEILQRWNELQVKQMLAKTGNSRVAEWIGDIAEQAGERPLNFAMSMLKSKDDILAFAQQSTKEMANPAEYASRLRDLVRIGGRSSAQSQAWLAAAKQLEDDAIVKLENALARPDVQNPFVTQHYLDELKAGVPSNAIENELLRVKFALGDPRDGFAVLRTQETVNLFVKEMAERSPNAVAEVEAALRMQVIKPELAPLWKKAIEEMPKGEIKPTVVTSARGIDELLSSTEALAKGTLLSREQVALSTLTNPDEITSYALNYTFRFKEDFGKTIASAIENKAIQPGTENYWKAALGQINDSIAARTRNFITDLLKVKTPDEMQNALKMMPNHTRDFELMAKLGYVDKDTQSLWLSAISKYRAENPTHQWAKTITSPQTWFKPEAPARAADDLMAAMTNEAKATVFDANTYAITHLSNRDEILTFAMNYVQKATSKLEALHNMQMAVRSGLVSPGSERSWQKAIEVLQSEIEFLT